VYNYYYTEETAENEQKYFFSGYCYSRVTYYIVLKYEKWHHSEW